MKMPEVIVVKKQGEWYWRCLDCGWLGLNCGTETYALQESSAHRCPVVVTNWPAGGSEYTKTED